MKVKTSVRQVCKLKVVVRDVFSAARVYHLTASQLSNRIGTHLYQRKDYQRLPRWAQAQLHGFIDAYWDSLYRYEVVWRVRLDGKLIDGDDVPKGKWAEVEKGAFVWRDNDAIFSDSRG